MCWRHPRTSSNLMIPSWRSRSNACRAEPFFATASQVGEVVQTHVVPNKSPLISADAFRSAITMRPGWPPSRGGPKRRSRSERISCPKVSPPKHHRSRARAVTAVMTRRCDLEKIAKTPGQMKPGLVRFTTSYAVELRMRDKTSTQRSNEKGEKSSFI